MRKILTLLLIAATSAAVAQKTIHDPNAEKRTAGGYHSISVSGGIDLYLSQGDESVAVSASEAKFRDRIKTEVKNGVLSIWYDYQHGERHWVDRKLKAYVSFRNLDKLIASGGSDIKTDALIRVGTLRIELSGGSDFDGHLEAGNVAVHASGGSDVNIAGRADKLELNASGGSDFNGYKFITDICTLEASGGSDVEITVNKELSAVASGSSDVYYKGEAAVKVKASGASSIRKTS